MLIGDCRFIWLAGHNHCHIVLFVAGDLFGVENVFIDGLPNSAIILLGFLIIIWQVIQRLLEEKLTALQCAVFDKTLADLKTRIEKVECNKRHKTVLTELQVSVCVLNCILESNLTWSSSTFSSKSPVVFSKEAILTPQREGAGKQQVLMLLFSCKILLL